MKKYNKLVRDKIPEIIEKDGKIVKLHILSDEEYLVALDKKLLEEVKEYQEDKNLEEMADILEVLYAICRAHGYSLEDLEAKRSEKVKKRGGFENKIFLESVKELESERTASVTDIKALKKWNKLSSQDKEIFLNNVYCSNCGVTTIIDYSILDESYGLVLEGKCAKCGEKVARVIENPY